MQWMTRAKKANQAWAVNSTITLPNPISGKHKFDEHSGVTEKGQNIGKQGNNTDNRNTKKAMMKVSEPEFEMNEENSEQDCAKDGKSKNIWPDP
eukprot:15338016-Ditylum_brightwellii.AAC.1